MTFYNDAILITILGFSFDFSGGSSYGGLISGAIKDGDSTGSSDDLVYDPEGGFGFFSSHMVDVHFQ